MEDMKLKEPYLHAVVKEYLESVGYEDTISAYCEELENNDMIPDMDALPSQMDEKGSKVKDAFEKAFAYGNYKTFWSHWRENIPESIRSKNETQRLEFKLQLYFAIYPMISDETRMSPVEASMQEFKSYLESNGAALSQTTEFVAFYALPFVPNPKGHPTFQVLFEESWKGELKEILSQFLTGALFTEPLPYLCKMHLGASQSLQEEKAEHTQAINDMKKQVEEHKHRADNYFKKFAKLQGDYHNLIGISAELVDSLEKCVRGQMITPEYLQDICQRLFGETVDKSQSIDLTKPGTASNLLRASIANENFLSSFCKEPTYPQLDYNRIQVALESDLDDRKKTLLLQALIWRMTKSDVGKQKDSIISSYISNDILGCASKATVSNYVTEIFESGIDAVTEYLSRFINTVASFAAGREYLAQSELLIKKMVRVLMKTKNDSPVSENVLGGLQKLSLRRHVQSILIDSAVIEWLFKMLEEPDSLSDYALEYTVALLMNLCLRNAGKKKCCLHPEKILKLLIDLLTFDNHEIRPYINGTLYGIISLPSIKAAALHMELEEILNSYMEDERQDQHQLRFIIKQLNTVEFKSDDDIESDGEDDDDDDDEEGDAVDAESEKEETISALLGEKSGEELLCSEYLHRNAVKPSPVKNKKIKASIDEPFTRPVTPATRPNKTQSNIELSSSKPEELVSLERPRTSSSKGTRRPPSEQARAMGTRNDLKPNVKDAKQKSGAKSYKQAFTTRPKIPRTPDSGSESGSRPTSSTEVPPLTRSISPSRPASGKAPKSLNKISPR